MTAMMSADKEYTAKKNSKKQRRVILQLGILAVVAAIFYFALFTAGKYKPYEPSAINMAQDKGFIALSYFGVDRVGLQPLISEERLGEHLAALRQQGYVTITQKDIIDFYVNGKPLPARALFLMFEDGRRDTAIFSTAQIEKYNYKATMATYPENFAKRDTKFLKPRELKGLLDTSFWELGTNGYRLSFINVFDRYDNYLGELTPLEYAMISPYLGRRYNHYLMDYIRDEYGVPKESYEMMKGRIDYDYLKLRDDYREGIGSVPQLYVLMHANTGSFGNNDRVSALNEKWIKELFSMNFNREGYALNDRKSSIYDLTRMQPQAYWYPNHLLMRIKYDINEDIVFNHGDETHYALWHEQEGAAEFQPEKIILTSLPEKRGLMQLKNSEEYKNLALSVLLTGNKLGSQKIYLRADQKLNRFISVSVTNNVLYVSENNGSGAKELLALDLDRFDGKERLSVAEDKQKAEVRELEAFAKYADSTEMAKRYFDQSKEKQSEAAATIDQGAKEYNPTISVHERGKRLVNIELNGSNIQVLIDGREAFSGTVENSGAGSVALESAWGGYGWSQRNLADDVYDGVFENLVIKDIPAEGAGKILYSDQLSGLEAFKYQVKKTWDYVINWFIVHL